MRINQFQLEMCYCLHIFYSHASSTYLHFHQISTSGSMSVTEPNRTFESLIEFNAHDFIAIISWPGDFQVAVTTWATWDDEGEAGRTDLLHRSHPLDPTSFRRHVTMWSSQPRTVSRAQRTCDRGRNRNELQLGAVTERVRRTESRDHLHPPTHTSILPSFRPSARQSVSSVLLHSSLIMDCTVATSKTYLFFLSMVFWVSQEGVPVHLQGEIYLKLLQIIVVSEREKANRQYTRVLVPESCLPALQTVNQCLVKNWQSAPKPTN